MNTSTYAVHQTGHHTETVDGLPVLPPAPTSIKDQMPGLATLLQQLSTSMGRPFVQNMLRAAVDLRNCYDHDDYKGVKEVYARQAGWIDCAEGGFQVGVPEAHMAAFAKRHRRASGRW